MAYIAFVIKAAKLKRKCDKYKELKLHALEDYDSSTQKKPGWLAKLQSKYKRSRFQKFIRKCRRKNTKENIIFKSLIGFLGGILLTYVYFFFFVLGFRFPLGASFYVCTICGIIFCLGMAFSRKIRCYVLLMIPVFFSKESRQLIFTYAMFLTLTGPVRNTVHNMGLLSDAMTCGQEMIGKALRQIKDMVKAPFRAIKDTFLNIKKVLKDIINKMKQFFDHIKRIIIGILHVVKKAVSWLGSIINFCNKKLGTPFQRCMKTFDDAIEDCKAKMGIMDFLCHVVHVIKALCYTVKFLDLICLFTEFVSDSIVGVVKRKLKEFGVQVKNIFYVSIEYRHSYEYNLESSNDTLAMTRTVIQQMAQRFEKLEKFFDVLNLTFSFFFIFIFFRVYYYKYKFMSSDRFDNHYLTPYIAELDLKRLKNNRETVLPLEIRERKHYCSATSTRLIKDELKNMISGLLFLSLSTLEVAAFIACDYSLYWVMFTIYHEGNRLSAEVDEAEIQLDVSGKGSLVEFYRKLGKAFKVPNGPALQINPIQCLPDPVPPDRARYKQIAFLIGVCWVLMLTEVYLLRLRSVVMAHYYPQRAKERAVWLYNHILRSRGSFLKFARRQLRRKLQGGKGGVTLERVTFKQRLFAEIPILGKLFGKHKEKACILCARPETPDELLKTCPTPGCGGMYCAKCYATLGNICTICQHPIEYGDLSDISEEKDSSEEDMYETAKMSKNNSTDSNSSDAELTFRDMETRPRFRDLERNPKQDFARKSDFSSSESTGSEEVDLLNEFSPRELSQRASQLIESVKKQKLKFQERRKRKLMDALKSRIREKAAKQTHNGDEDNIKKYEAIVRKAKELTERLKQMKSEESIDRVQLTKEKNYDELKKIVRSKLIKALEKSKDRRIESSDKMNIQTVNYVSKMEAAKPFSKFGVEFSLRKLFPMFEEVQNEQRPLRYHIEREVMLRRKKRKNGKENELRPIVKCKGNCDGVDERYTHLR